MSVSAPMPVRLDGSAVPVKVTQDRTLRVKITEACGPACTFCHNEGTPVAADNRRHAPGGYTVAGPSGRRSIYLASNGASFLPATIAPDEAFTRALRLLGEALDVDEVHLTGGEPTLHPRLTRIVRVVRGAGLRARMTSNGETGLGPVQQAARAGLEAVTFSIFGTTPAELTSVQGSRDITPARAEKKIRALRSAVHAALACQIGVNANIVVPDVTHAARVHALLDGFGSHLSVRLLNSLDEGKQSLDAIEAILDGLGAVPVGQHLIAGSSGWRTTYRLPSGRRIQVKRIRPVRLPGVCGDCRFNNPFDCQEGYYGVRLYRDRAGGYQVGVCLRRMDRCLPVEDFARSDLPRQIIALRESQYLQLAAESPLAT